MKTLFLICIVLCCSCATKHKTIATTQNKNATDSVPNYDYGARIFDPRIGAYVPIK